MTTLTVNTVVLFVYVWGSQMKWAKSRIFISAHGSKWIHYQKTYYKISKNSEHKFCMYILTCYVCTQIFRRKEHFYVLYKKRNLYMNISLFIGHIFVFFTVPHKMFFVVKNLCANIEYPDLHVKFIFKIFWHLKFVFYAFSIIGSYTPESQNTSSAKSLLPMKSWHQWHSSNNRPCCLAQRDFTYVYRAAL
jgi:hypothetical protein